MYVLDASAVLAVLLGEDGKDMVEPLLRGAEMSIINLSEVLTKTVEQDGDPLLVQSIILNFGIRIRSFREAHAVAVAKLRSATKAFGLGFGDRACLAQGMMSARPVLTGDRDWLKLELSPAVDIRLIR